MKQTGLIISMLVIFLLGCASSTMVIGTDFDATKIDSIQKGKTTRDEVLTTFGTPYQKSVTELSETWTYTYIRSEGQAYSILMTTNVTARAYTKSLTVLFDTTGIVTSSSYTVSGDPSIFKPKKSPW